MSAVASRPDGRLRADETAARVDRDALVSTGFGIFCAIWLAFALSEISGSVGRTSSVLGVFFLGCGALFALLMAGGLAGGKAAAGAVILAGSARFVLSGLDEVTRSTAWNTLRASLGSCSPA